MSPFTLLSLVFDELFFKPVVNLLVLILRFLQQLGLPGSLGFAIVILTVLIRLVVWPFMSSQLKSAKKMADLKPEMDKLKSKHKGDKQAFAAAQMALYKEHGINPAGGCLPTLIQFPVIIALYQAILALFSEGEGLARINDALYFFSWHLSSVPDANFFGLSLAAKPSQFNSIGFLVLTVPVITGLLTLLQSKMMAAKPVKVYPSDSEKEVKEKVKEEDTMQAVQSQMMYMMPVMIGYFSYQFPIGLAIYWNTFTILGMVQQYMLSGWGGLEGWMKFIKKS